MKTKYKVLIGWPSWHQSKAGASCAGMLIAEFTPQEVETYKENYAKNNPGQPCNFIPIPAEE